MSKEKRRALGEGSIFKRASDGLYCCALSYIDPETGERKRPTLCAKTKDGVRKKLDALKAKQREGVPLVDKERLTLAAFLDKWLLDVVQPSKSPNTHASYAQLVRLYIAPEKGPSLGRILLKELTPDKAPLVQAMLNRMSKRGLSPRTVQYTRAVLRSALNQAMRWGLVSCNVATLVEPPRQVHHEMPVFTMEEAIKFLEAVKGHRLEALFSVALALGLRRGEAVGLRWQDIDLEKRTLTVAGSIVRVMGGGGRIRTDAKTSGSHRTIVLPRSMVAALKRRRAKQKEEMMFRRDEWVDTDYVFTTRTGGPLEPRFVSKVYTELIQSTDLPPISLHKLRHSCATLLHAQGESLQTISKLLGHSTPSITAAIYTHLTDPAKQKMADTIDDMYGADGGD